MAMLYELDKVEQEALFGMVVSRVREALVEDDQPQRQFCQNRGCGASLTSADIDEAQACTQCGTKIQAQPDSLEFTLRASLRRVREAKGKQ